MCVCLRVSPLGPLCVFTLLVSQQLGQQWTHLNSFSPKSRRACVSFFISRGFRTHCNLSWNGAEASLTRHCDTTTCVVMMAAKTNKQQNGKQKNKKKTNALTILTVYTDGVSSRLVSSLTKPSGRQSLMSDVSDDIRVV